jgi:hypothetical protein
MQENLTARRTWRVAAWVIAPLLASFLTPSIASPATITVTGTGDTVAVDGVVTLREAITSINNGANVNADVVAVGAYGANDRIAFMIPGSGVHTIAPLSALPTITVPVTVDGYSQPGASPNTLSNGDNATILIELDGSLSSSSNGLTITAGNCTISGLVIGGFFDGIHLITGGANTVSGNFVGTRADGTTAHGNHIGIFVESANNIIGGTVPAARNIASANVVGIGVNNAGAIGNLVEGNFIGTDAVGTTAVPNSLGINIAVNTANTTIGGTAAGARNVVSGNTLGSFAGIILGGAVFDINSGITIQGNYIGVDVSGQVALGNCTKGILTRGLLTGVQIGGTAPEAGNVISGNCDSGIGGGANLGSSGFIQGNLIGTDLTGTASIPNGFYGIDFSGYNFTVGGTVPGAGNVIAFNAEGGVGVVFPNQSTSILGNSIFSNQNQGIDLGEDTMVENGHPVLTDAFASNGSATVDGTLTSAADTDYRIEFFSNASCDPSGYGEGQKFLGFVNAMTDGSGNASFSTSFPIVAPLGQITATATDSKGNTSEFSACISPETTFYALSPCRVVDTRNPTGPYGGPALGALADRAFVLEGQCGIPSDAEAVSLNVTETLPTAAGDLKVFAGSGYRPLSSTLDYRAGQTRANNAIVSLGPAGDILVHSDQATGTVHLIIDVNGFFR